MGLSIIIPTLQKEIRILNKLIEELSEDSFVDDIILIDNSRLGYSFNSSKLRVIIPEKNLYVNSSWNLGIQESKNEFFGILNDDLILPTNFCAQVLKFLENNECGLIGLDKDVLESSKNIEKFKNYPQNSDVYFAKMNDNFNTGYWGAAIFGNKKNYYPIPEKLKIYCGDNFLYKAVRDKGNYKVTNCKILHYGSLSSNLKEFSDILKEDIIIYSKMDSEYEKFINIIINRQKRGVEKNKFKKFCNSIFSIKNEETNRHKVIRFLGIKMKFKINKGNY